MTPTNIERIGYENLTQNQLRQAQANQLVQEALHKQEMLPYEKMRAEAYAKQVELQGREKPIDPKKTAEAQMLFQSKLYPYMAAIQAQKDTAVQQQMVDALLNEARGHGDEALAPILASPEGRKAFFEAMGRSKEVAKLQHGQNQNAWLKFEKSV